jgi:hypothetical protein
VIYLFYFCIREGHCIKATMESSGRRRSNSKLLFVNDGFCHCLMCEAKRQTQQQPLLIDDDKNSNGRKIACPNCKERFIRWDCWYTKNCKGCEFCSGQSSFKSVTFAAEEAVTVVQVKVAVVYSCIVCYILHLI